jgi:hypothetical protein
VRRAPSAIICCHPSDEANSSFQFSSAGVWSRRIEHSIFQLLEDLPQAIIVNFLARMKSPAPGEVMGINNMLQNGSHLPGQGLPKPESHQLQPLAQLQQMDRADSPHGSEHSRFSAPPLNGMDPGRPYGSPTAMHAPMHLPEANMGNPGMVVSALPSLAAMQPGMYKPADAPQPPPKAYPCSTCGKGFARRSDLARHGASSPYS